MRYTYKARDGFAKAEFSLRYDKKGETILHVVHAAGQGSVEEQDLLDLYIDSDEAIALGTALIAFANKNVANKKG